MKEDSKAKPDINQPRCKMCEGTGLIDDPYHEGHPLIKCHFCNGTGVVLGIARFACGLQLDDEDL